MGNTIKYMVCDILVISQIRWLLSFRHFLHNIALMDLYTFYILGQYILFLFSSNLNPYILTWTTHLGQHSLYSDEEKRPEIEQIVIKQLSFF